MVRSLALLLLVATASADPAPRVAIIPGIAVNLDTARVDALSQDLAEALSTTLVVDAAGGLEVRRLLPAEGLPPDCVTKPACTSDVARRANAQQLLFVVMVDSGAGGSIQVDTTWVDPATNRSASRPAIDLTSIADAKARFAAAAHQLLPDAQVREKPATTTGSGLGGEATMSEAVPRHFTKPAVVTAAIGAVGLGAGIAFGLHTRSLYHACEGDPGTCSESDRSSIRTNGVIADVGWLVAIGGVVATGIIYMSSAEKSHVVVSSTKGGGSVSWVGRF